MTTRCLLSKRKGEVGLERLRAFDCSNGKCGVEGNGLEIQWNIRSPIIARHNTRVPRSVRRRSLDGGSIETWTPENTNTFPRTISSLPTSRCSTSHSIILGLIAIWSYYMKGEWWANDDRSVEENLGSEMRHCTDLDLKSSHRHHCQKPASNLRANDWKDAKATKTMVKLMPVVLQELEYKGPKNEWCPWEIRRKRLHCRWKSCV